MAGGVGTLRPGVRVVRAIVLVFHPSPVSRSGFPWRGESRGPDCLLRGKALGRIGRMGRHASLEPGFERDCGVHGGRFLGSSTWSRMDVIGKVAFNVIAVALLLLLGKNILSRRAA